MIRGYPHKPVAVVKNISQSRRLFNVTAPVWRLHLQNKIMCNTTFFPQAKRDKAIF